MFWLNAALYSLLVCFNRLMYVCLHLWKQTTWTNRATSLDVISDFLPVSCLVVTQVKLWMGMSRGKFAKLIHSLPACWITWFCVWPVRCCHAMSMRKLLVYCGQRLSRFNDDVLQMEAFTESVMQDMYCLCIFLITFMVINRHQYNQTELKVFIYQRTNSFIHIILMWYDNLKQ